MRHGVCHTSVRVVGLLMGWASFVTASATGVAASICAASRHFFLHHRATRCAPRSILCASMQPKPPATADCIRALQCSPFAVTFSFVCASELSYRKRFVLANVKISRGASGQSCASDRPIIDNHEHGRARDERRGSICLTALCRRPGLSATRCARASGGPVVMADVTKVTQHVEY